MSEAARPRLSLVVPAFNEEHRIDASLQRIGAFLTGLDYGCELIVVDDGSDATGRSATEAAVASLPAALRGRLLRHETNHGKGAAVRTGCLAAQGEYVAFIDADVASPPEDLTLLLAALTAGADVAVGVRVQQDGSDLRNRRRLRRRLAGRLFATAMRLLLVPGMSDSQCPLKAFRRDAAQRLFRLQRIESWAFDAELLFLASRLGLCLAKIPVHWQAMAGSHLNLRPQSGLELWNLLRIRWTHRGVGSLHDS